MPFTTIFARGGLAAFLLLVSTTIAWSLEPKGDLLALSFEELLQITIVVEIASPDQDATEIRETPAILTVVTAQEIADMGARDLIDILRHVPGFSFGWDTQQATGLAFRGNWAIEGKILLLMDGFELNERRFAVAQVGNRFPMDLIERVEIIRGPGSVLYGGFAELAVINIITKKADDLHGGRAWVTAGFTDEATARAGGSLAYGETFGDLKVAARLFYAETNRTDGDFTNAWADTRRLRSDSDADPLHIGANLEYRNLKLDFLLDSYSTKRINEFGWSWTSDGIGRKQDYDTLAVRTSYEWELSDNFKILPKFEYRRSGSYLTTKSNLDILTNSYTSALVAHYSPWEWLSVFGGGEYYADRTKTDRPGYFDGSQTFSLDRFSGFGQAEAATPLGRFSAGARYDSQGSGRNAFVPRLGYTGAFGDYHVKALASQAFRAPIMENIEGPFGDPSIDPELTTIVEGEMGYRLLENLFVLANLYHITIKDPIIWTPIGYTNLEAKTKTLGVDAELRYVSKWGSAKATYSFNRVQSNSAVLYEPDLGGRRLIGMPTHQISAIATLRPCENLSATASFNFTSQVSGYRITGVATGDYRGQYGPYYLLNLNLRYENLFIKGLEGRFAVHDLLNQMPEFVQPYRGDGPPLPGPSREYTFSLVYVF